MLKPQAIKDQEFQVKFRGYDPVEVRNYLELLAEDFFELLERNQELKEQIDTLEFNGGEMNFDLDALDEVEGVQAGLDAEERKRFEEQIRELSMRLKHAETMVERAGTENMGYLSQVGELSKQLEIVEAEAAQGQAELASLQSNITSLASENSELKAQVKGGAAKEELERLQQRIAVLESENRAYRDEEHSVKQALAAAQTFAETSRENAEKEAERILEEAQEKAGRLQLEMAARADNLPKEIEELEGRKEQARIEVRSVLQRYLSVLEECSPEVAQETGGLDDPR